VQVGSASAHTNFSPGFGRDVAAAAGRGGRTAGGSSDAAVDSSGLSPEEVRTVARLRETDRAVRQHEQAHLAAGAGLVTGGPTYSYTTGPDGKRYAVGGEVSIDVSPGRTPEATIAKAQQVRAAALAPADPSGKDRQVAVAAARLEAEARAELLARANEGGEESREAVTSYADVASGESTTGRFIDTAA